MPFELLNTTSFLFTQTGLPFSLLRAEFGDGYAPPAAIVGSNVGAHNWSVKIGAMTNDADGLAEYLWQFWQARKAAGNSLFWVQDPKDGQFYLGEFVDDELSFEVLCAKAFASGLRLRQRRDPEQVSPVVVPPGTPLPPDWPIWGETEFGG